MNEELVSLIRDKLNTLNNWVSEMTAIVENPYSAGLNTQRMLTDLKGFAGDLTSNFEQLVKPADEPEADKKAGK